ncbi:helix-turn-helix domain-containing protein [Actinoallomurus rhizosphaericola]|uniref:helix-turn-helix domain-containing protein n=1 Tax=Actinoallomurus rhizosphaericola TaxID=2952536 RepID=UPI002090BF5C|nr:helix-turn-helix domain-containing protein [Actinoallomurus rhizosphaericola]MCO5993691.1 helix-turn-helix domain-containing protein [Actinoallomurus rhizosphaericola]
MNGHEGGRTAHRAPEALNQEGAPRASGPDPALAGRDVQALTEDQMIVYEALATVRRPMSVGDVAATTGMDEDTVRNCLRTLADREMIVDGKDGIVIGENDWDVRGARPAASPRD